MLPNSGLARKLSIAVFQHFLFWNVPSISRLSITVKNVIAIWIFIFNYLDYVIILYNKCGMYVTYLQKTNNNKHIDCNIYVCKCMCYDVCNSDLLIYLLNYQHNY